jgi:hypothetical protein
MKLFNALIDSPHRKILTIGLISFISGLFTCFSIFGAGSYGIALFILIPLFIGAGSTIIYGYNRKITRAEGWQISWITLLVFSFGLMACAVEGLICIVMAAPFAFALTWIGSLVGQMLLTRTMRSGIYLFILMFSIPATAFVEKDNKPELTSVTTIVDIKADPETVWQNVIQFPDLKVPTELLFKTGIAYPIDAQIDGLGVGAVRHCNFTTGSFVEPITVWDEPKLLKFAVKEQPAPMKEVSFWDIDAPHLHDYFVSKQGQFRLTKLKNGYTRLSGTTWYYHNIRPAFYWRIWSNYIIHAIHERVLTGIKAHAEKGN